MNDLISRQAAVEEIRTYITKPNISDDESEIKGFNEGLELAISVLSVLPSAQPERETDLRKQGEWDMFNLITSVYFGKQYYFQEEDGIVYSRQSGKHMTREKAIQEFLDIIGE